ncbi:hypothetical protein QQ020_14395 [Fulvivirgaceae bacterium BMA12]|uniref:Uncharacterized protein n=1 Tax=Agaribacillus aureus TaxID=3051825 RepID=A0ABT8L674_9BACT|nr:hypothetical protein [Fulvivirgaceae bacterium BMA12]
MKGLVLVFEVYSPKLKNMNWKALHTIGLLVMLSAIFLFSSIEPQSIAWFLNLAVLLLFTLTIGHGITGSWKGIFVDERNKVSLSRFQLLLWTVILLSAFITIGLIRIYKGISSPLTITLDEELWILMGISTTSLVGSPLIRSTKTNKSSEASQRKKTVDLLGGTTDSTGVVSTTSLVNTNGQIIVNRSIDNAGISDLFKGEETGNAAAVDLAKIQMFFFTIIIMMAYIVLLCTDIVGYEILDKATKVETLKILNKAGFNFPALDDSMLALLAISHTGYLVNKAVPHSKE